MVKKSTFCKHLYHRKCKQRGVGGQKKQNLVNIVCERPLILISLPLPSVYISQYTLNVLQGPCITMGKICKF
mgnify:CR=1 FL=1